MSLLIKALNKAEEAQAQKAKTEQAQVDKNKAELELEGDTNKPQTNKPQTKTSQLPAQSLSTDVELTLSPTGSSFTETSAQLPKTVDVPMSTAPVTPSSNQRASSQHVAAKSAANVFSAKGAEAKTDSARIAMIAGAGLIALLGMGLYFYQFVDSTPPIIVPSRPPEQIAAQTAPSVEPALANEPASESITPERSAEPALVTAEEETPAEMTEPVTPDNLQSTVKKRPIAPAVPAEDEYFAENVDEMQPAAAVESNKNVRKSKNSVFANNTTINNTTIASKSASIQVSRSTPQPSVSPVLMSAYEAYNAGNDVEAQKLYKQVLQRDIRNVDALLGLGAIASKQGRVADANGWYGKVLEVDPRNSIAKTAMLDSNLIANQSQENALNSETNLKNMLNKYPDDVNLHVALGNLYAEQNQWSAAQQAYFDAYSLNKTTDNAYNLAVSLDQMGKPKLALPYYMRALEQATDTSNIDKAALQARIAAIK